MIGAIIVTDWVVSEAESKVGRPYFQPRIVAEYPDIEMQDITGQPGENIPTQPNLVAVAVVVSQGQLEEISISDNYEILSAEEV